MPGFVVQLSAGELSDLQAEFRELRAQGWAAELDRDAASQRFARAALLIGARLLSADLVRVTRVGACLRAQQLIAEDATDGQAAAAAVGAALTIGLPRLLGERSR